MRIAQVEIENFRLLSGTKLALQAQTTVIVGRNNSGKTSLSEIIRRFLADGSVHFGLEDFSSHNYDKFCQAHHAWAGGAADNEIRPLIPSIRMRLELKYEIDQPDLGPLAPFVIDLDEACDTALVIVEYGLKDGSVASFFEGHSQEALTEASKPQFFRLLRERVASHFTATVHAEDPNDATNRRELPVSALRGLIKTGFINAQRGLDDLTSRESDVLGKVLENLFSTASSVDADADDQAIVSALNDAVQEIQTQIDNSFAGQLETLLPTLQNFGYPGLDGQELRTETTLDVKRLLSGFTKVKYAGHEGISLPETYNGLGVRNLIFILLQLVGFYKAYRAEPTAPSTHLIFVEEPEAHLHPQMQEVFIRQLSSVAQQLITATGEGAIWPVQFVVSTHSSHVANEAGFESIRYFLSKPNPDLAGLRATEVKDLSVGLAGATEEQRRFLHQYLTLTRCDLFFADKAILIEGLSERVILPKMISKIEAADENLPKISTQYVTTIEVGGAYAHRFFDLLNFLEIKALIITDIDSVLVAGGEACAVHQGTFSSNACIRAWFENDVPLTLEMIRAKTEAEKCKGRFRLAYQQSEIDGGPCGRTFEDAFILANSQKFEIAMEDVGNSEIEARVAATKLKKSDFALKYAIEDLEWNSPRYLVDGLRWLASNDEAGANHA